MKNHLIRHTLSAACILGMAAMPAYALEPIEELGQFLYFDENLSEPAGQSCASCHHPDAAFVDPDAGLPVSEGVIPGLFGGRNSPSAAYAMYSPTRYFDAEEGLWIGGSFWDSRATGDLLGDPLADQALGPFLNPVEMANESKETVIRDVRNSHYAGLFEEVWGPGSLENVETAYDQVALSIAAFERTLDFGQFTSKYDAYLQSCLALGGDPAECAVGSGPVAAEAGKIFTKKEWDGMQLFMGENNNDGILEEGEGAMCSACHVAEWTEAADNVVTPDWAPEGLVPPLFTDFTYDNLGIPKSDHWILEGNPIDEGLGFVVGDPNESGKFKVMTLRNIQKTKPYGHNGFFMSLADITHFYNTRDVEAEGWAVPEYPATVNTDELGNLGLSDKDEDALVKFMKTLDDGWVLEE
ncbi:MAG: cytochrome c peroxidase [Gammaproteobacteria bacterium]|jgi:cytochrome c peroxidase